MKILFLTNLYPPHIVGGYEICCKQAADFLMDHGHTVEIVTSFYNLPSATAEGNVHRVLRHQQHKQSGGMNDWPRSIIHHKDINILEEHFKRFDPDVIYVFSLRYLSLQILPFLLNQNRKIIFELADDWPLNNKEKLDHLYSNLSKSSKNTMFNFIKKNLRSKVDSRLGVKWERFANSEKIFVSNTLKDSYIGAGMAVQSSSSVIHNSIDLEKFKGPSERGFAVDGKIHLLFTGQVAAHKSPHTIIEAMVHLKQNRPELNFHFDCVGKFGSSEYEHQLRDLIARANLSEDVTFHGKLDQSSLITFYASTDIFIFSSQFRGEGFGLTLVEAMACGAPVISTVIGGAKDVVEDQVNCLVYKLGDARDLSEKILRIVDSQELRSALCAKALEIVRQKYDEKAQLAKKEYKLRNLTQHPTKDRNSLKILVLTNFYPPYHIGGYEIRCEETVNYLMKQGHTVTVLTSYYGLVEPCVEGHIHRLLKHQLNPVNTGLNDFPKCLFETGSTKIFNDVVESEQPDLIYVFNMSGFARRLLPGILNKDIPKVFDFGDNWLVKTKERELQLEEAFSKRKRYFFMRLLKDLYAEFSRNRLFVDWDKLIDQNMIFNSHALKELYAEHGLVSEKAIVIYSGVDTQQFPFRLNDTNGRSSFNIMYAAQLEKHKGAHFLIGALAKLKGQNCRRVQLDIIGGNQNTKYFEELKELINKNHLNDKVKIHGQLERNLLAEFYHNADVFVSPTMHFEGLSRSILEAMSCGVPVVAAPMGGNAEILKDGINALTVDAEDEDGLMARIMNLMNDTELAARLSCSARNTVEENFNAVTSMQCKDDFLKEVSVS